MKFRLLASIAITAIMAGSAFAADMPLKAAPAPYLTYDWSGIYIGGVIGGQWSRIETSAFDPTFGLFGIPGGLLGSPGAQTFDTNSFIGGVEGGDRYQFGKLVVGWEADVVWGDRSGTVTTTCCNGFLGLVPANALVTTISANERWTATATSTVGIAHDRWLIYGKAGVAWTHNDFTVNSTLLGAPFFSGTGGNADNNSRVGWTVGTGIEWAIWNNWSIKAEYDYLDFGTRAASINGSIGFLNAAGLPVTVPVNALVENDVRVNQFKFGINWHIMPNLW
jgi:outer membrane immunogenic protein